MQLLSVIQETGVETSTAVMIQQSFDSFYQQAAEWEAKAKTLVVTDVSQTKEMKMAREARLALKNIRVAADKRRKELKEDSLRYGKAVQTVYNTIEGLILPIEEHLEKQEKFAEIQEANRKKALLEERTAAIAPYKEHLPFIHSMSLVDLSADDFEQLMQRGKEAKIQAEESAKIEAEKTAAEQAKRELHEARKNLLIPYAQFIEGFLQVPFGELTDDEFAYLKAAAIESKENHEREQARIKAEKEALEAKLKAEREAKAKAEADLAAKLKAEQQAQKAAEKAAKKAAAAPDIDKLKALALQIQNLQMPEMRTEEAAQIVADVKILLSKISNHIESKITAI